MKRKRFYTVAAMFALSLLGLSFIFDRPKDIFEGMKLILTSQDLLITDYIALAGAGAAFFNAGLVTLMSVAVLCIAKDPVNGCTIVDIGLMAGFALFGKNIINIWPIILGTYIYSKFKKTPFREFSTVALLATALSPVVSFGGLTTGWNSPILGFIFGVTIGFVIVPLSQFTYRIQNGMNLYNMGFACGLLATQ